VESPRNTTDIFQIEKNTKKLVSDEAATARKAANQQAKADPVQSKTVDQLKAMIPVLTTESEIKSRI